MGCSGLGERAWRGEKVKETLAHSAHVELASCGLALAGGESGVAD